MARFRVNDTLTTDEPEVSVETRATQPPPPAPPLPPRLLALFNLAPGKHRFQLIVEDDRGQTSLPAIAEVTVLPAG